MPRCVPTFVKMVSHVWECERRSLWICHICHFVSCGADVIDGGDNAHGEEVDACVIYVNEADVARVMGTK